MRKHYTAQDLYDLVNRLDCKENIHKCEEFLWKHCDDVDSDTFDDIYEGFIMRENEIMGWHYCYL